MKQLVTLFLLVCCHSFGYTQNELRPLLDKSLLKIAPFTIPAFEAAEPSAYFDKIKLKSDFEFFNPYIQQGMKIVDFQKIPINQPASSRQIFTIKHASGRTFTVINRMPGFPFNENFNKEMKYAGTSFSFDFNQLVYYAFHPNAKAQKKRTVLKRTQITQFVYQND